MRRRTIPGPGKFESIQQLRERAESGDFGGLLDLLGGHGYANMTPEDRERALRSSIQSAAQRGTDGLLENLMDHLIEDGTRHLLLAQAAARRFESQKRHGSSGDSSIDERGYLELERAARIADRLIGLAQARARLRHLEDLSDPQSRPKSRSGKIVQLPLSEYAQEVSGG